MKDKDGNILPIQIAPTYKGKYVSGGLFEVLFEAKLPALSLVSFSISFPSGEVDLQQMSTIESDTIVVPTEYAKIFHDFIPHYSLNHPGPSFPCPSCL